LTTPDFTFGPQRGFEAGSRASRRPPAGDRPSWRLERGSQAARTVS